MSIFYSVNSGKNSKWIYFVKNYLYYFLPKALSRRRIQCLRERLSFRADYSYILRRVDYYNAMCSEELPLSCPELKKHKPEKQKVYFFDSYRYTSLFPQDYRWSFLPGDIIEVPPIPTIVKSRPLGVDNRNSVIMKLDKVRHFLFVNDKKAWRDKCDKIIFRGKVLGKACRINFMKQYYGHPMIDAGDVGRQAHPEWRAAKKTIEEHLDYKFVMALEGNDVASNLKWIMSSSSIAVMPRPTCETWFMEGTLIPNIHYIEVAPDLSDLMERVNYYLEHPEEAEQIIRNANEYVAQFIDEEREDLISYLVLERYFIRTHQLLQNEQT